MKIKPKLTIVFVGLIVTFTVLAVLANVFFLENFYLYRLEEQFVTMHNEIEEAYENILAEAWEADEEVQTTENTDDGQLGEAEEKQSEDASKKQTDTVSTQDDEDSENEETTGLYYTDGTENQADYYAELDQNDEDLLLQEMIRDLEKDSDVKILVLDGTLEVKASSYTIRKSYSNVPLTRINVLLSEEDSWGSKEYTCSTYERRNEEATKLFYMSKLTDDRYLVITKPVSGIRSSIKVCNEFYLYVGIIMSIIGILVGSVIAKYISGPIIKMSKITTDMSNLEFSNKIHYQGKDEIGILGNSINKLSVKLNKSILTLQKDVEHQKMYVRNLSHELKTPIAVIQGYADGLQYGVADDVEKRTKYCRVIRDECKRMNQMVQGLLDLAILENDNMDVTKETSEMLSLLKPMQERFQQKLSAKKIQFQMYCSDTLAVTANSKLLSIAIENFISNAVKYTPVKGRIIVTAIRTSGQIGIIVYNSGNHIGEEHLDKLWDVFYKEDKARSRQLGGHGIGLSIVKSIVELHEGNVFVHNVKDGVEFGFCIPQDSL